MSNTLPPLQDPQRFGGMPPAAGRPKRPWFRRKRFIIPIGFVLFFGLIGSIGRGGEPESELAAQKKPVATATANATPSKADVAAAAKKAEAAAAAKVETDRVAAEKVAADAETARVAAEAKAVEDAAIAAEAARVAAEVKATEDAAAAAAEAARGTVSQQNAKGKAGDYLDFSSFSRSGLIEQLEFEGFSTDDATWAVDRLTVDWNAQAAGKAKDYLEMSSFSRSGLIEQLEFEGYSAEQAEYGVSQTGL